MDGEDDDFGNIVIAERDELPDGQGVGAGTDDRDGEFQRQALYVQRLEQAPCRPGEEGQAGGAGQYLDQMPAASNAEERRADKLGVQCPQFGGIAPAPRPECLLQETFFCEYDFRPHVRINVVVGVFYEAYDEQYKEACRIDAEEEYPVLRGKRQVKQGRCQDCGEEGIGQERDDCRQPFCCIETPLKDALLQKTLQLPGQRIGGDGKDEAGGEEDCG